MNSTLNRYLALVTLIAAVAILFFTGAVIASPADSTAPFEDSQVFQIDGEEPIDEAESENGSTDNESDNISVDINDSDDDEDSNSSLTPEEQEELDNLPIDVDEDDVNSDEIGEGTDDDNGNTSGTPQVGSGGLGPSLSPEDNAEALSEWLIERMYVATEILIDDVFNNMLGTPTPENDGWQGILGQPVGDTYSDLYEEVYMDLILPPVFQFMILGFIAFSLFVVPFSPITGQRVWRVLLGMFGAAALILLAWNFASLLHHVSDAVTMWFLPQSDDFLNGAGLAEEAGLELASGPLAVLLGVYFASWNVGIGLLLIHGMRQAILFFMPTILPIILVGMYFGPKTSKAAFSVLFWQYIGLLVMNWPTALLLSIAYHVNFDFGMGEVGTLPNLAATIGLFIFAIGIPLLVQSSFLGGSLVAIIMKGSMLSAGASTARRYFPSGSMGGAARSAAKRGGGYINPVSRHTRSAGIDHERQRRQRDVANQVSSTTGIRSTRYGQTATDGGYTARINSSARSRYRSDSHSKPISSTHDAGSVDARRRERYRRLRGNDSS